MKTGQERRHTAWESRCQASTNTLLAPKESVSEAVISTVLRKSVAFLMQRDALALEGNALKLYRDAMLLQGHALALQRDALTLYWDAIALQGHALALQRDALTLYSDSDWGIARFISDRAAD